MQSMDEGLDTPDVLRWNIEIYFGKPDGSWNMYRTYIPYRGSLAETVLGEKAAHEWDYKFAKKAALKEFDTRDDIQAIEIAFRDIYSINLEVHCE